jgi:hypothetical protein
LRFEFVARFSNENFVAAWNLFDSSKNPGLRNGASSAALLRGSSIRKTAGETPALQSTEKPTIGVD